MDSDGRKFNLATGEYYSSRNDVMDNVSSNDDTIHVDRIQHWN
jgi:hypothetical protein